ncbi:fimbrial protein [Enterobacter ludwigii]|uniref:fimbrial protein n=1 Tax=Enterobacter ludwigii TaxID=299767 RepID=UPI0039764955
MSCIKTLLYILFLIYIPARQGLADVACGYHKDYPYHDVTVPVGTKIYAGNEIPVGTILYKIETTGSQGRIALQCETHDAWTANVYYKVTEEPSGSSFNFSGNPFNGEVYPTNISGVGVAIYISSSTAHTITTADPFNKPFVWDGGDPSSTSSPTHHWRNPVIYFNFVKTGPIASGDIVHAQSAPTVTITAENSPGLTGLPLDLLKVRLTGDLIIDSSTCRASDATVYLGDHEIVNNFRGKGSATPWVNASIELTDCPTFMGYYSHTQVSVDGNSPQAGQITSNNLLVSITSNTGLIDPENGIISINKTDPQSADGIGIQLGYGDGASTTVWDITTPYKFVPDNQGTPVVKIPLMARYYQTDAVVSPGTANGQVMFTINYQ